MKIRQGWEGIVVALCMLAVALMTLLASKLVFR
jgi:hypothetical protein